MRVDVWFGGPDELTEEKGKGEKGRRVVLYTEVIRGGYHNNIAGEWT